MENQQLYRESSRGILLLLVVVLYLIGLMIWTPLFLGWPRRYAGMTVGETVATRCVLVRHIWSNLVRTESPRRRRHDRLPGDVGRRQR